MAKKPLLSRQRRAVLIGLANGLGHKEIARALRIAQPTVNTTVLHMYEKLGVHDRAHAVAVAFTKQIISGLDILDDGECPGIGVYPNYCKCRCEGCKHSNCAAHIEPKRINFPCPS